MVHVTLQTDRVGNQLAPPADVKLRGMIVGEVRSVSSDGRRPTVDIALQPEQGRPDPGQRVGPAAAQDAVRREVRRPGAAGQALAAPARPRATSSRRTARRRRSSSSGCSTTCCRCCAPIQPAKLNATLGALATALEGRGEQLGDNLDAGRRLLHPAQPRAARPSSEDISGLADGRGVYADAAPDLVRMLRNFR